MFGEIRMSTDSREIHQMECKFLNIDMIYIYMYTYIYTDMMDLNRPFMATTDCSIDITFLWTGWLMNLEAGQSVGSWWLAWYTIPAHLC